MSSDGDLEFREEIRHVIRRHDPDAEEFRDLASGLESLASPYEATEEQL